MCIFLENDRDFDILHEDAEELSAYFSTVDEMVSEDSV